LILDEIEMENSTIADDIEQMKKNPKHQVNFKKMLKHAIEYVNKIRSVQKQVKTDTYNALYLGVADLMEHIVKLLKTKKDNNQLSINDFNQTVRAIQSMRRVLNIKLSRKHTEAISKSMVMQVERLSGLKTSLYGIYEVKQAADNKITILYDHTYWVFGYPLFSRRLRSDSQHDSLEKISSKLKKEEGWGERLTRMVKEWYGSKFSAE